MLPQHPAWVIADSRLPNQPANSCYMSSAVEALLRALFPRSKPTEAYVLPGDNDSATALLATASNLFLHEHLMSFHMFYYAFVQKFPQLFQMHAPDCPAHFLSTFCDYILDSPINRNSKLGHHLFSQIALRTRPSSPQQASKRVRLCAADASVPSSSSSSSSRQSLSCGKVYSTLEIYESIHATYTSAVEWNNIVTRALHNPDTDIDSSRLPPVIVVHYGGEFVIPRAHVDAAHITLASTRRYRLVSGVCMFRGPQSNTCHYRVLYASTHASNNNTAVPLCTVFIYRLDILADADVDADGDADADADADGEAARLP